MSPAPAAIFTPKILYLYLTLKSLKNPNPLTTIPAHQPQHHHHPSLYIVTFLTSAKVQIDYRLRYAHTRTRAAHNKLPVDPCATRSLLSSIVDS